MNSNFIKNLRQCLKIIIKQLNGAMAFVQRNVSQINHVNVKYNDIPNAASVSYMEP